MEAQRWPEQGDFQRGRVERIADQQVRQPVRPLVHRTRRPHAVALEAVSTKILQAAERAGGEHFDHLASPAASAANPAGVIGTKRTRSPGRSKQGEAACGVNSASGVRPSRCQPPGLSSV